MIPFLCEIALCCIVSYHVALLVMQGDKGPDKLAAPGKVATSPAANPLASRSAELSGCIPSSPEGHPLPPD
jgi:hypothetical protein